VAPLHAAEHRGYRELALLVRRLAVHWGRLHRRLATDFGGDLLAGGAADAEELLAELAPLFARRGLHVQPGAQRLGTTLGRGRAGVVDRFLECNQALRTATVELRGVVALLAYLGAIARGRDDDDVAALCERWHGRLRAREEALERALVALGGNPDRAVLPIDSSPAGRAAHGLAFVVGSVGEWSDRRAAERGGEP
jgi:hypothetical protein